MTQSIANTADVGKRLRQKTPTILQLWETRARQRLVAAQRQSTPSLLDHLPLFLRELAETLESPSPREARQEEEKALASRHGRERAQAADYSLEDVVEEYQLLRQVVLDVLEVNELLNRSGRDIILDAIHIGVRNATSEFVKLRQEEMRRAHDALAASHLDLESRVQARTADLARSEERFRTMVEAVQDYALFTLDTEGCISSWNAGAERMKGYTAKEAIGQHFEMLYPEEGCLRGEPMNHLKVAAIEGRYRGEGVRRRKDGAFYMADVSISPMYEHGELTGYSNVVQDLTERNLLMQERDLTRSHAQLLEAEAEYRKRFVATLTHDLRSPLSAAKSAAQMIGRVTEDHDKVRIWAVRIGDAVDRTDRMISDLLDASRLEAGERLSLVFSLCDLKGIAEEVSQELSTHHGDRFIVRAEGNTQGYWSADGLRRILENLLSNAVKYGDPTEPITTQVRRVDSRVLLTVHNQGAPLSLEDQGKLFQPFHRTRMAQASNKGGWGLGLTLVRAVAEAHQAIVKVESYPKEGTTFTVDLPEDSRGAVQR